jgi:hypothetical protein
VSKEGVKNSRCDFNLSRWWLIVLLSTIAVSLIYLSLWQWGHVAIGGGYKLAELLKDGSEISLKIGALIGGILAAYKYLYRRYEPLVYHVSCGLIPFSLIKDLLESNPSFKKISHLERCHCEKHDYALQICHDLPMVVLHKSDMTTLDLKEGAKVDLEFTTPDGKTIWVVAYAFSFESTGKPVYDDWPVGLSLSLRRFFRIERPFQSHHEEKTESMIPAPKGWQIIEHNAADLAILHQTYKKGEKMVWIASEDYSVRFRDRDDPSKFFPRDSFKDQGRIMEYVGISLRVLPRSWFRYTAS